MTGDPIVLRWWAGMSIITLFNICLLIFSVRTYKRKRVNWPSELVSLRNWQMYLAMIYTFGCGFRAILPRGDIRRIVLVDHWISAVAIGRTVATIAELSFIIQLSLIVYEAGKFSGNKTVQSLAKIPVPLIIIAECFSWYACTTTNYIGSVVEESLWGISGAILMTGMLIASRHYIAKQLLFIRACAVALFGYVLYMAFVDVPNYVRGYMANQADGKVYSSLKQGFIEVATQWRYTRTEADWKYEFVWMTLYFSFAVWVSISLMNAPRLDQGRVTRDM